MLSANTRNIIQCLQRSFSTSTRSLAYAASHSLTDPLEDDAIIPQKKAGTGEVQITKLDNGIKVASCDHGGAVSKIVVSIQAGSRFESTNQLGVSHLIKNAAFISNGGRTNLRTVRETQQIGGALECSSSRELILRKSVALRTKLPEMLENIAPGISSPVFSPWELTHVKEQCKGDLATLDCTAINVELLHEAAYRNGLGNSIYCNDVRLGNFSERHLEEFARQLYIGAGLTIVGTNVDHNELVRYSKDLLGGLPSGAPGVTAIQQYHGGEIRANTSNGLTYVSLVGPGVGLCSADLPAFAVLQKILGEPTSIKSGSNTASSRLNRAARAATHDPSVISSLNLSYSDAGLFGLQAVSTPSAIGSVLQAAVREIVDISNGKISSEDVAHAKNQLKSKVLISNESSDNHIDDLLKQVVFTGGYVSTAQTLNNINAVSLEKVLEIAKQTFSVKSTLAVTGDSSTAPYLDELY